MSMKPGMIEGEVISLGGQEYIVPPLNFKSLRKLQKEIKGLQELNGIPTPENITDVCKIFLAALQRNYPSMTLDEVEDKIDLGNFAVVIKQVLVSSGVREKKTESQPVTENR